MGRKVAEFAKESADREAIRDCLTRYSRGADRIDRDAMLGAYWPDAIDDHGGVFKGPASDLIEHVLPLLRRLKHTTHFLGNMLIEIDGEHASAETYVLTFYTVPDEDHSINIAVGARYVDRLEKRDDEWRISRRTLVIDWSKSFPDPDPSAKSFVSYIVRGARMPDDPSYEVLGAAAKAR
jgi:SnoaL-like domain